ncbi:DELLA protein RGL1-like isoform X1 [Cornus florida]|uniref:DELLA protein RGL1-like isoform X1 n=1 Tax=Cornus florida TaxID=4283 RepID=UPI00289FDC3C|nr:DELLA protein RGL1-like isoform X1 [Cornus florida]XP_059632795.1 DELLA protein RGL1-like isoform X1 [Cornus florida]
MSAMNFFEKFGFAGYLDNYSPYEDFSVEGENLVKQIHLYGTKVWGEPGPIGSFCPDQDSTAEERFLLSKNQQEEQQQLCPGFGILDDLCLDVASLPFQSSQVEIPKFACVQTENSEPVKPNKEEPHAFPLTSFGILKDHGSRVRQLKEGKTIVPTYDTACTELDGRKLSTETIMRLAGEKFIQSSAQRVDDPFMINHPFSSSYIGLSDEEAKDVELVQYLLASAEKVGQQQFDRASKLLNHCASLSSRIGNPVERVVYYFSEALQEKIDQETGRIRPKGFGKKHLLDLEDALRGPNVSIIEVHQKVPFSQLIHYAGMQAITENTAEAKKVHIIDLEIRSGMQYAVLMQALASRCEGPVELLKITAIGTTAKPKIEETGKRLMSFAQSLNLLFSFNVVEVSDILDLNENLFELDAEEAVAVYSSYLLRTMIAGSDRVEHLMKVIRNIKPRIMLVSEVEANHNSPVFVNRFLEALFYYGGYFDSLEDCMDRNDSHRFFFESVCLFNTVRNIIAAEGEERITRHVNINAWRAFFAQFGMKEIELSSSSLYQASLAVKNFACKSSCTLGMDGKCLIIGWKGTPIYSLSAWKFL